jgi:hypothetical protein
LNNRKIKLKLKSVQSRSKAVDKDEAKTYYKIS